MLDAILVSVHNSIKTPPPLLRGLGKSELRGPVEEISGDVFLYLACTALYLAVFHCWDASFITESKWERLSTDTEALPSLFVIGDAGP